MASQTNINHLTKLASEMASTLPNKIMKSGKLTKLQQQSSEDIDQIIMINSPDAMVLKQPLSPGNSGIDAGVDLSKPFNVFYPDVYTFYGYSIPKNTLYLIIILIIAGIIVWYMTSNTKKKKENTIIDNDDREKDREKEIE